MNLANMTYDRFSYDHDLWLKILFKSFSLYYILFLLKILKYRQNDTFFCSFYNFWEQYHNSKAVNINQILNQLEINPFFSQMSAEEYLNCDISTDTSELLHMIISCATNY